MRRCSVPAFVIGLVALLAACAPTFNWREQTIGTTALTSIFPCKPETVTRSVTIAGHDRSMAMRSCDSGGVTFAVAHAGLSDPGQAPMVLAAWRASTLAGLHANPTAVSTSQVPTGLPALPQLLVLHASGAPPGQKSKLLIGAWFAQGADVFAAFVMAPVVPAEVAEPYFAGLRLR